MTGLLNFAGNGGASNWLGPYVNAGNGSFASTPQEDAMRLDMLLAGMGGGVPPGSMAKPASPFDNAVPYSPQKMPSTLADTMPQGPPTAPPLAPPVNIGSMPIATPQDAIPPAARPAQYAPQGAPQAPQAPPQMPQAQGAQLPSFLGGGGDFLDGLKNRVIGGLSIMNPQAGQAYMQQQIMRAALPQLLQQTGGNLPKAMALLQNQKLQEQIYGNPTSLGEMKAGNVSVPVYAQGGKVGYAAGGQGGLGNLVQLGNQVAQSNAAAEATGKAQGTNAAGLPQALAQADQAVSLIDNIKNDPGLSEAIGPVAGRMPAIGGQQANVIAKIDQLKGQAFLQAWQSLKGAGARITNTESMRATDAIGRLQRTQSPQGFNQALSDLRNVIVGVRTRAGVMAGGQPTPPPEQAQQSQAAAPSFSQDQLRAEAIRRGLIKQ
jgi:hypothetical protein